MVVTLTRVSLLITIDLTIGRKHCGVKLLVACAGWLYGMVLVRWFSRATLLNRVALSLFSGNGVW